MTSAWRRTIGCLQVCAWALVVQPARSEQPQSDPLLSEIESHFPLGEEAVWHGRRPGIDRAETAPSRMAQMSHRRPHAGYWVHPYVRLQLTGMLGETWTGLKPGASSLTQICVVP